MSVTPDDPFSAFKIIYEEVDDSYLLRKHITLGHYRKVLYL